MLLNVRAAGKYPAMIQTERSRLRRAIDIGRRALGMPGHQDAMLELERATDEVRDRLERLRRESKAREGRIRIARPHHSR